MPIAICVVLLLVGVVAGILVSRGIFNVVVVFLLFALFDVYIPSLKLLLEGFVFESVVGEVLTSNYVVSGLLYYSAFLLVFFLAVIFSSGNEGTLKNSVKDFKKCNLSQKQELKFFFAILIAFALVLVKHLYLIFATNEFNNSLCSILVPRSEIHSNYDEGGVRVLWNLLPFLHIFCGMSIFGCRVSRSADWVGFDLRVIIPIVSVVLSFTSFSRGFVLSHLFALAYVHFIRSYAKGQSQQKTPNWRLRVGLFRGLEILGIIFAVLVVYGGVRDQLRSVDCGSTRFGTKLKRIPDSSTVFLNTIAVGHGLNSISAIVKHYGNDVEYIGGRTYFDMLLLPVPRLLWVDKPERYGVVNIDDALGWPKTSQSAVTMAGEAFANFGSPFFLFVAAIFGLMVGILQRIYFYFNQYRLLFFTTFYFSLPLGASWFSFTGVVSLLPAFSLCLFAYILAFKFSEIEVV